MTIVADLHVHTQASDGILSAAAVVELAQAKGLAAMAITDHDTVDGVQEAQSRGRKIGVKIIPGVEMSTEHQSREIHILGFYIDPQSKILNQLLQQLRSSRYERMKKMVSILRNLGYRIDIQEVLQKSGDAAPSRPHVARVLVEKGYFKTVSEVFHTLLDRGLPAYVERFKLTPALAIEAIKAAGGLACWAHPGLVGNNELLPLLITAGLQGLEIFHPDHHLQQEKQYLQLAAKHQLLVAGGSDYHGPEAGRERELAIRGLNAAGYHNFIGYCQS
ncbi:MAG TPA: PHP domain-containing protein, partial [Oscillospiraceae bacterium]|nr:PHP domain-containing protein [Oscillospiraceae bacterium]